jgi:hypothetical protein
MGSSGPESSSSSTGASCLDPDTVELPGDMFFPESIGADSMGRLYVGSITSGEIVRITPCDNGMGEHVVESWEAGDNTIAALGIVVDETNNALWVCSSDITGAMAPSILGFSLDDASLIATHAFDGGFCNDIAFDTDGNMYATESFGSRIMRVAAADVLSDMDASEWSTDSMYTVAPGEFGLNGIAFDGDATIYVVNYAPGEMYSVGINGNGSAANPALVDLGATMLVNPDGMRAEAGGTYLLIEQGAKALDRVTIGGVAGNTVEVLDDTFDFPTAVVAVDTHAWVVESQLDHLLDPAGQGPPDLPFVIVRRALP